LELVQGGELFDFVALTGAYKEDVARYYFRQLIEGLDSVHQKGITHRDLKPENILYDADFNLKIADFGFAASMDGRDGSYLQRTILGTFGYMAPEIFLQRHAHYGKYNGAQVDLFASAIILFIMVAGHPPFSRADPNSDKFYHKIFVNRPEIFWDLNCSGKKRGLAYFSQEFKNLITNMLQYDPTHRLSLEEIKSHPWY
jgi:serine/threonine protein kinase